MTTVKDTRIAFGAQCTWWDTIDKASQRGSGIPCCPYCMGVLYEVPNMEVWEQQVRSYDNTVEYDYPAFIRWTRGQCFPNFDIAYNQWIES